jgi:hypothetical protein
VRVETEQPIEIGLQHVAGHVGAKSSEIDSAVGDRPCGLVVVKIALESVSGLEANEGGTRNV